MKELKNHQRIILADEGMKLTQADDHTALSDRIVTSCVYLAVNDTDERWKEITDAEAEGILNAQAEALEIIQNISEYGNRSRINGSSE